MKKGESIHLYSTQKYGKHQYSMPSMAPTNISSMAPTSMASTQTSMTHHHLLEKWSAGEQVVVKPGGGPTHQSRDAKGG